MRRIGLASMAVLMGLLVAAPALAQSKDPFEPVPGSGQEDSSGGSSTGGNRDPFDPVGGESDGDQPAPDDPTDPAPDDPTVNPAPTEQPAPDGEVGGTLSRTGFDVTTWGGIAYVLIAVGLAALAFGLRFGPKVARRRRG